MNFLKTKDYFNNSHQVTFAATAHYGDFTQSLGTVL